jgi:hypothetical protein
MDGRIYGYGVSCIRNFNWYSSRVWRSVGCGRVCLAADSFEVGRLSSYRKFWEEHVSLYGGQWRHSIVGAGKWRVSNLYAEVPLWSAIGPIARRWIVPTCVWKLSDCKNGSECWKIATRGPVSKNSIGVSVLRPCGSDVYVCSESFWRCLAVVYWLLECNKVPSWIEPPSTLQYQ